MPSIELILACAACAGLLVFDAYLIRRVRSEVRAETRTDRRR